MHILTIMLLFLRQIFDTICKAPITCQVITIESINSGLTKSFCLEGDIKTKHVILKIYILADDAKQLNIPNKTGVTAWGEGVNSLI